MTDINQQEKIIPPPLPTGPAGQGVLPAWEDERYNSLTGFFVTCGQILFKPFSTFTRPNFPGYGRLLLFYVPCLFIQLLLLHLSTNKLVLKSTEAPFLDSLMPTYLGVGVSGIAFWSVMAASLVAGFLIKCFVLHVSLSLTQKNTHGWHATFRYVVYTTSIVPVLLALASIVAAHGAPIVGFILLLALLLWNINVHINMLRGCQGIDGVSALLVLFVYLVLSTLLDFLLAFMFSGLTPQ